MAYTNSPLVNHTNLSPNHSGERNHIIDRITPHSVVGQCTVESLGFWFSKESTGSSSNYGIGYDGKVGLYVEEKNRSWCSNSKANDHRAVTIECASDKTSPYAFTSACYNKLIDLCVDICRRNGKAKLIWFGNKDKALNYEPASDEMILTAHRWFVSTTCPGDWMYSRMGDLAKKVTAKLSSAKNDAKYRVQVGAYSEKENAQNMVAKLKVSGFDAIIIDNNDKIVENEVPKKSNAEIAQEIYRGICSDSRWTTWGHGTTRIERLKAAGYDPTAVQKEVNKLF